MDTRRYQRLALAAVAITFANLQGCADRQVLAAAESTPVAAATPEAPGDDSSYSMFAEETGRSLFVELARTELFLVEMYSTVRFVPWRSLTTTGEQTASIRMSLGYGTGISSAMRERFSSDADAQRGLAWMGAMVERFEERLHFQLTPDDARRFVRLLDELALLDYRDAPGHVGYRFAQLVSGDLRLRRDDDGIYVWIPGDPGGWEPIAVARFRAGVEEAIARLDRLVAAPSSIAIHD